MAKIRLGRTNLTIERNAFGALPIQRIDKQEAVKILRRAYEGGMQLFDTARAYSDSEQKIGIAFEGMRDKVILATKTKAVNEKEFWSDLHESLSVLKTDYIDIYQFHNPSKCFLPEDQTGLCEAMAKAKSQGKIRFIGFTNHRMHLAIQAVESGFYDSLEFPFSYLADEKDKALVNLCFEKDVGFICMKALSGGLITDYRAAYSFIAEYPNTLPIWGIQRMTELEEFLSCIDNPPMFNNEIRAIIEKDRRELTGDFCRGCGYCLPCPAGIDIPSMARMSLMLRRMPVARNTTPEMQKKMLKIEECIDCRHCVENCPYNLNTPALLRKNLEDYKEFIKKL
jgi:predicted aldo/keto reductase-like oxidoreductase